jgi:hypothetical protein
MVVMHALLNSLIEMPRSGDARKSNQSGIMIQDPSLSGVSKGKNHTNKLEYNVVSTTTTTLVVLGNQ